MKQPWWLTVLQITAISWLGGLAIVDAMTDHGVLMAINCMCLGFVAHSIIAAQALKRMSLALAVQGRVIIDMAEQISGMIGDEFPSIQPGNEDRHGPTRH